MMKSGHLKAEEARRKAHGQFAKPKAQEGKGLSDYEKARQATAAKTARLRALRLEKEAADREAAANALADESKSPKAVRSVRAETGGTKGEDADEVEEREPDFGIEPGFGADGGDDPDSRFATD